MKREEDNIYKILNIAVSASKADIKAAYKKLCLIHHPDRFKAKSPEEQLQNYQLFFQIQNAYETLMGKEAGKEVFPLIQTNPLELEYLSQEFPGLTYEEIDGYANIIEGSNIEELLRDRGKSEDVDKSISSGYKIIYTKLYRSLPYQRHPMKNLSIKEMQEKIDQTAKYADVENVCDEPTFLWVAEKSGCGKIYIFGTIHTINPALLAFEEVLKTLIEKSEVVFTEIKLPMHELQSKDMSEYTTVDIFCANIAFQLGKELQALETREMRDICCEGDFFERYKERISEGLAIIADLESSDDATKHRVYTKLLSLSDSDTFEPTIRRNRLWMDVILHASESRKKTCFIADGAIHNRGKNSIPNYLHHEGYTLKPLMKTLPLSKDALLRQSLQSQHTFYPKKPVEQEKENDEIKQLQDKNHYLKKL